MSTPADLVPLPPRHLEILLSLHAGPRHGYGIAQDVHERTEGALTLATSTLYAGLRRLLRDGLVEECDADEADSDGPPRRTYRITSAGRAVLQAEARRVSALADAVRARGLVSG